MPAERWPASVGTGDYGQTLTMERPPAGRISHWLPAAGTSQTVLSQTRGAVGLGFSHQVIAYWAWLTKHMASVKSASSSVQDWVLAGGSVWVQFVPFAMILAIFYFVILLPMKRRQKKVKEFQEALKVNDRIVTTSGLYGIITKLNDERSVQVQIAEKVRVDIARAAIGGYQGQEPVVKDSGQN